MAHMHRDTEHGTERGGALCRQPAAGYHAALVARCALSVKETRSADLRWHLRWMRACPSQYTAVAARGQCTRVRGVARHFRRAGGVASAQYLSHGGRSSYSSRKLWVCFSGRRICGGASRFSRSGHCHV